MRTLHTAKCDECHGVFNLSSFGRPSRFCSKPCRRRFDRRKERAQLVGMGWKAAVREEESGAR